MPGRTFFHKLSTIIAFAAAPLVSTPFFRKQLRERLTTVQQLLSLGVPQQVHREGDDEEDHQGAPGEGREDQGCRRGFAEGVGTPDPNPKLLVNWCF